MKTKNLAETIISKIKIGESLSPILFISPNTELLNSEIYDLATTLLGVFEIPKEYIYVLKDTQEKIKIAEIKQFFSAADSKPNYTFQIFFIENAGRMTREAANSCLKRLEEPGVGNIILLSNSSENQLLETILSRVQTIKSDHKTYFTKDNFFYDLIDSYTKSQSSEIVGYFYNSKLEKEDYLRFLDTLILYAKDNLVFLDILQEIDDDIYSIKNNNVLAKYIADKYLLKIIKQ